jgi:hypothetical protein
MEFHDENDIDSDEYENLTPPEVVEKAAKVCENLLPSMSKDSIHGLETKKQS